MDCKSTFSEWFFHPYLKSSWVSVRSGSEIKVLSHDMISKSVNMKKTLGLLLQLFDGKFFKNIMSAVLQTINTCMIIQGRLKLWTSDLRAFFLNLNPAGI